MSRQEPGDPAQESLVKELALVRKWGAGQPLDEQDVPRLSQIAQRLAEDPSRPVTSLTAEALALAIERFGDGPYGEAAAALFGLKRNSDGRLVPRSRRTSLGERLDDMAVIFGIKSESADRLRGTGILEDVARQVTVLGARSRTSRYKTEAAAKPASRLWLDPNADRTEQARCLLARVADLRHACLTSLFVVKLCGKYAVQFPVTFDNPSSCCRGTFSSYGRFLVTVDDFEQSLQVTNAVAENISNRLKTLRSELEAQTPLDERSQTALVAAVNENRDTWEQDSGMILQLRAASILFLDYWHGWHCDTNRVVAAGKESPFDQIVRFCLETELLIGDRLAIGDHLTSEIFSFNILWWAYEHDDFGHELRSEGRPLQGNTLKRQFEEFCTSYVVDLLTKY